MSRGAPQGSIHAVVELVRIVKIASICVGSQVAAAALLRALVVVEVVHHRAHTAVCGRRVENSGVGGER